MNKTYEQRWLKDHYAREYPSSCSGYLLKDGLYIDLVDKRDVDRGAFYRDDHRTICRVYNSPKCEDGTSCMFDFMKRGNIRYSPESPGFMLYKGTNPTLKQLEAMREAWRERGYYGSHMELYFEICNEWGCIIYSTTDYYEFCNYLEVVL